MAKMNTLAQMLKNSKENAIAESFIDDLVYTIEKANASDYVPTKSFKPSSISGCERSLFYQLTGVQPDEQSSGMNLIGICESGTDRHESIQHYIQQMNFFNIDCEWLDVGEYLQENNIKDPVVISKVGNETKLFSEKYNMRFMCDGLIRYKGQLYIVEIKTESSFKYNKHDEPHADHKLQATCYSMCLKVPSVLFIYENRDNCSKKAFLTHVTSPMIRNVEEKINRVNRYVDNDILPPREDKCTYCNYKNQCRKDGK